MVVNGLILVEILFFVSFLCYTVCWSCTDVAEFGNESSLVSQARHLGDASE